MSLRLPATMDWIWHQMSEKPVSRPSGILDQCLKADFSTFVRCGSATCDNWLENRPSKLFAAISGSITPGIADWTIKPKKKREHCFGDCFRSAFRRNIATLLPFAHHCGQRIAIHHLTTPISSFTLGWIAAARFSKQPLPSSPSVSPCSSRQEHSGLVS